MRIPLRKGVHWGSTVSISCSINTMTTQVQLGIALHTLVESIHIAGFMEVGLVMDGWMARL